MFFLQPSESECPALLSIEMKVPAGGIMNLVCLSFSVLACLDLEAHVFKAPPTAEEREMLNRISDKSSTADLFTLLESNSYYVSIRAAAELSGREEKGITDEFVTLARQTLESKNRYTIFAALLALAQREAAPLNVFARAPEIVGAFEKELYLDKEDVERIGLIKKAYCRFLTHGKSDREKVAALVTHLGRRPLWVKGELLRMGEPAAGALVQYLESKEAKNSAKSFAILILGEMKSRQSLPVLKKMLAGRQSGDEPLLGQAASALIRISGDDGIATVKTFFEQQTDWLIRLNLVRGLAESRSLKALKWLREFRADAALLANGAILKAQQLNALTNQLELSIATLEVSLARDRIAKLVRMLHPDQHLQARRYAAKSLVGLRESSALRAANDALSDPDSEVRRTAIQILGNHGGADSLKSLKRVLKEGTYTDRLAAVEALKKLGLQVFRVRDGFAVAELKREWIVPFAPDASMKVVKAEPCRFGQSVAAALKSQEENLKKSAGEALEWLNLLMTHKDSELALPAIKAMGCVYESGVNYLLNALARERDAGRRIILRDTLASHGNEAARAIASRIDREKDDQSDFVATLFDTLVKCGTAGEFVLQYYSEGKDGWKKRMAEKRLKRINRQEE